MESPFVRLQARLMKCLNLLIDFEAKRIKKKEKRQRCRINIREGR